VVVLSTTHKAKGLEWDRVFLLSSTYRITTGAGEEANIYYVAVTRAKSELYLVGATKAPEQAQGEAASGLVSGVPLFCGRANEIGGRVPVAINGAAASDREPLAPKPKKLNDYDLRAGSKYYKVGDVRMLDGAEYVCEMVNDSRSRWICLTRESHTVTNRLTDKTSTFLKGRKTISICATYEENDSPIIRRYSDLEMKDYLSGKARTLKSQTTNNGQEESTENNMPRGIKSKKRGDNKSGSMLAGSAPYIRKQHEAGTPKAEIEKQAAEKFGVWPALFARIWARVTGKPAPKMEKKSKATKPAKASAKAKTTKVPARKSKPAAKPVEKKSKAAKSKATPPPRRKPAATVAPAPTAQESAPAQDQAQSQTEVAPSETESQATA